MAVNVAFLGNHWNRSISVEIILKEYDRNEMVVDSSRGFNLLVKILTYMITENTLVKVILGRYWGNKLYLRQQGKIGFKINIDQQSKKTL